MTLGERIIQSITPNELRIAADSSDEGRTADIMYAAADAWEAMEKDLTNIAVSASQEAINLAAQNDKLTERLAEAEGRVDIERAAGRCLAESLNNADEELRLLRVNARPALAHDKEAK